MATPQEEKIILEKLGRKPSPGEMSMIDALWSEHCSYKSSKRWFHLFKTESERVKLGIGEGAGLLDVGDGYVVGIGLESHNHPSAVDPFNGAATGVGGIIRDIVSQGCRPIAVLDCLRFGYPIKPRQKLLLDQVVLGISSYGNCVGVPNLGGDLEFADEFEGNPLVNAMCVGVAKQDEIIRSVANTPGDKLLLFGSSTGRDGIGGVTFASEELDGSQQESRGSVQIGDPLTEKLLIDAVLEMRDAKLLNGLQDLGGGGLACAAAEMAEKGKTGVKLELTEVPVREDDIQGWEILVSESQERMLAVLPKEKLEEAIKIIEDKELAWAVVGQVTESSRFEAEYEGEEVANISVDFTINGFPEPVRIEGEKIQAESEKAREGKDKFLELLGSFNVASKEPVYQQYDQQVQGNTVITPGGDAGVLILPNGKYLAVSAGTNSYLTSRDAEKGAALATLQILRSVVARGATPIGMVDSINAGNPEKENSYREFVDMIRGVAEVSREMDIPIVGGNISLYNESEIDGTLKKILPSPFIGIVGLIENKPLADLLQTEPSIIFQIGEKPDFLEGSQYHRMFGGKEGGMSIDYEMEKKLVENLVHTEYLSCTDIGKGGLITTLAKWSIRSNVGCKITLEKQEERMHWGENSPRYLVQVPVSSVDEFLKNCEVPVVKVAEVLEEKSFIYGKRYELPELRKIWTSPIKKALQV